MLLSTYYITLVPADMAPCYLELAREWADLDRLTLAQSDRLTPTVPGYPQLVTAWTLKHSTLRAAQCASHIRQRL